MYEVVKLPQQWLRYALLSRVVCFLPLAYVLHTYAVCRTTAVSRSNVAIYFGLLETVTAFTSTADFIVFAHPMVCWCATNRFDGRTMCRRERCRHGARSGGQLGLSRVRGQRSYGCSPARQEKGDSAGGGDEHELYRHRSANRLDGTTSGPSGHRTGLRRLLILLIDICDKVWHRDAHCTGLHNGNLGNLGNLGSLGNLVRRATVEVRPLDMVQGRCLCSYC